MNAVFEFLADPVRLEEKLVIPVSIRTQSGYLVDTTGPVWRTPPALCNFDWSPYEELGVLRRVLQAHAAELLDGRTEGTARHYYSATRTTLDLGGWQEVRSQWISQGEISFATMLGLKELLLKAKPKNGLGYFGFLRRWYYWANGLRIPGFTDGTADKLRTLKGNSPLPYVVLQQIAPGASRSKASKNRRCYTGADFARIQAGLLHLEGRLNSGEIVLSSGVKFGSLQKFTQSSILKDNWSISTRHLVLGWLACVFGDRPKAFCDLRESDFEFLEIDGVKLGTVRLSDSVKHQYGKLVKPAKRAALPLNDHLIRLIPLLIEENHAWAVKKKINLSCDLPLFLMRRPAGKLLGSRITLEDEAEKYAVTSISMNGSLKMLFKVLNVKTVDGKVIVPTFYSFRDGNHSAWARKMPLESVAALAGKRGIGSFKHYMKPGIRHIARLDEVTEYQDLAQALNPPVLLASIPLEARIPAPFPYVQDGERRVGVEGGCGCFGGACPMAFDGTADCYTCPTFTPCVEGCHEWVLRVLVNRQAAMIARGLPETEWRRYDRHIAAVGRVIQLVDEWRLMHLDTVQS